MKAKYNGIIHEIDVHGKIWSNDGFAENCQTRCGLFFSEMGINFHGEYTFDTLIECEICDALTGEDVGKDANSINIGPL